MVRESCFWLVSVCGWIFKIYCYFTGQVCLEPPLPVNGGKLVCPEPFTFGTKCSCKCDPGYEFPANAVKTIVCDFKDRAKRGPDDNGVAWNAKPTDCKSRWIHC